MHVSFSGVLTTTKNISVYSVTKKTPNVRSKFLKPTYAILYLIC